MIRPVKVLEIAPQANVAKQCVCDNCGVSLEYVPANVKTLWEGTDYGGGPAGAKGIECPNCAHQVVLERW